MIGILYPDEMGSSFGKLLTENGFRVVTTTEGRSPRTHRLCCDAGLNILDSIGEALASSDIVILFVPPEAALQVAKRVTAMVRGSPRKLLHIYANSISPMTAMQIFEMLRVVPVDFVDASIHGLASQLQLRGIFYLSGSHAKELANLFGRPMRVKVVGDAPGQDPALKMISAGMSKSLVGLFMEMMLFPTRWPCSARLLRPAMISIPAS